VPQYVLEESVKGVVNRRPKVTPSQCSESASGITLSWRLANACRVRDSKQIYVTRGDHLAPDSLGHFVLFLMEPKSSFLPAFNPHAITSEALLSQSYPIHLSEMAKPDDAHWVAGASTIPSAWAWSSGIHACALGLALSSCKHSQRSFNLRFRELRCSILLLCLCANGSCTSIEPLILHCLNAALVHPEFLTLVP